jgi:hypothetical protein
MRSAAHPPRRPARSGPDMPRAPLTRADLRQHSPLAWLCLAALAAVAAWLWSIHMRGAAQGTVVALLGCLGLILPPRERMHSVPHRLRTLPRSLDAAPVIATLVTVPGYGLGWFYGANPYDEAVHLLNGGLAGAVFGAALLADDRPRGLRAVALAGAAAGLALGVAWEVFEWATGLIGDASDTASDIALTAGGVVIGALAVAWRRRR